MENTSSSAIPMFERPAAISWSIAGFPNQSPPRYIYSHPKGDARRCTTQPELPDREWTLFSPIILTILLLRGSGITLLERTLKEEKAGYKEYIETTSEFIPWFPCKK